MVALRSIGVAQRRARLGLRHRLAAGADGVAEAAESMVALHATDPATVFLSAMARARTADVDAVEHALYTDRALVRMLGMRRTVWVVPREVAPVVQEGCSRDVAAVQRRRLVHHLTRAESVPDPAAWLDRVGRDVLAALAARGEATAAELVTDVPELRRQIRLPGEPAAQNATSRVLLVLSAEGHLVRGRPVGSWTSTRYRWSPTSAWWPAGMPTPDATGARVELARRWLAAFGPAPVTDLQWWTGWTLGRAREALVKLGAVAVDLDGEHGVALPGDVEPWTEPAPWVALLPALDPTPMGWQRRDWFLGEHRGALFDRNGNIGPTVWCDGRVAGGWAQLPDGTIVVRLLEDVGSAATAALEAEAERLAGLIGPVRVTPRFRTPLERELTS